MFLLKTFIAYKFPSLLHVKISPFPPYFGGYGSNLNPFGMRIWSIINIVYNNTK